MSTIEQAKREASIRRKAERSAIWAYRRLVWRCFCRYPPVGLHNAHRRANIVRALYRPRENS